MISKHALALIVYVVLVTGVNIILWSGVVQGGPAPRSGRIMGLIVMLAICALFSDRFSSNQYAPVFIKVGSLMAMTLLLFFLYNR